MSTITSQFTADSVAPVSRANRATVSPADPHNRVGTTMSPSPGSNLSVTEQPQTLEVVSQYILWQNVWAETPSLCGRPHLYLCCATTLYRLLLLEAQRSPGLQEVPTPLQTYPGFLL